MTDASGISPSEIGPLQTVAGRVVDYVRVSERRRIAVIVSVPFLFWLLVELAANLGFLPLIVAVGLGAYLYRQETVQETLAASAYVTGLLAISVALFQVYQNVIGGSTEPLIDTIVRLSGWPLTGAFLIVLGVWFHRADL